jgi:hypothetical protein
MAELQSNRERLAEVQAIQVGMAIVSAYAGVTLLTEPQNI